MVEPEVKRAIHWITQSKGLPWIWDRTGSALVTESQLTIALREEIVALVSALAPGGLPPLGALALLLAACGNSWSASGDELFAQISEKLNELSKSRPRLLHQLAQVRSQLDAIHALPAERRATTSAKLAHAVMLRDRCGPDLTPSASAEVAKVLMMGVSPAVLRQPVSGSHVARLLHDVTYLHAGLGSPQAEVIQLVERTGLETLPQPASTGPDAVRALLARAASDDELNGLAALAQRLLAAVHLPRPLADHQDLPVGGVSDLSNRGSLDRLLVGELTNDDLVLAVRVATGEALYLRREAPPRQPLATRSLLIDAGIRMWGLPRVFAAAVALALAASAPRGTRVNAWRARSTTLDAVDLGSHDGLVRHLAALETIPQPGASLAAWSQVLRRDGDGDAVIITHAAALDDPAFAAALAAARLPAIYCATVDSAGVYRLFAIAELGRRLVQEATLDLKQVLGPVTQHRITLLRTKRDEPLIYGIAPFPLLLPHPFQSRSAVEIPQRGVLAATADGRLMLWEPGRGVARQLTDQLPPGGVTWMGTHDGSAYLVIHQRRERTWLLVSINLDAGVLESVPLPLDDEKPQHVLHQGNGILVIWKRQAAVYHISDGRLAARMTFPADAELRQSRFLVSPSGWHALSWNGIGLALLEVCKAGITDKRGHYDFAFFDRVGRPGPWGMTRDGSFVNMGEGEEVSVQLPPGRYQFLVASDDGERVLVAHDKQGRFLVDLTTLSAMALPRPPPQPPRPAPPQNLSATPHQSQSSNHNHNRVIPEAVRTASGFATHLIGTVRGIFRSDSCLAVWTHRRQAWILDARFAWHDLPHLKEDPVNLVVFSPLVSDNDRRQLRIANAGGSEFLVDARGLLHCRRPHSQRPELSLVLQRGETALWSSDGMHVGPKGFFADGISWHQQEHIFPTLMLYAGDLP